MKDRSLSILRTQLCLAAGVAAIAFPLGGCAGKSSTSAPASDAAPGSAVQGAPGGTSESSPTASRRRLARILASLGLSDEQKAQIRQFMNAARKESANADPETRRANYKAAFAKIDTILSPDQRAKLHAELNRGRKERDASAPSQS